MNTNPSALSPASVSVVIPTYNSGHFVTQAIDSILAQTRPAAEIIVVDDGSSDDTPERLAQYRDRIRYVRQSNQGVSSTRNRGIQEATAEFVAFLDADDVWHPRKLELQMGVFRDHPELGLVGTHSFDWPATKFPEVEGRLPGAVRVVPWCDLVVRNQIGTSSVVVRRDLLRRAGPFDTQMQGPEDRDLWLRVAELAPVANLELPLMGYRNVPGSLSKRADTCLRSMRRILQKLDQRRAWGGRRLLRRKAYSYVHHSCALLYDEAGRRGTAILNGLQSMAWYPFPYRRDEVRVPLERPRRLLTIGCRLLGLKAVVPEPQPLLDDGLVDALQALKAC